MSNKSAERLRVEVDLLRRGWTTVAYGEDRTRAGARGLFSNAARSLGIGLVVTRDEGGYIYGCSPCLIDDRRPSR